MRKTMIAISIMLITVLWPQKVHAEHVTLEEGSPIKVRLLEGVSTETHQAGDPFDSALDEDLIQDGYLLAPEGSLVVGRLTTVEESKKVKGRAVLEMTLESIEVDGRTYPIESNKLRIEAKGTKKDDAKVIGGGAGIGALLGAILGGKKGAVIGATIGAGAGTTAVLMTEGDEVTLEPEQQIQFTTLEEIEFTSLASSLPSERDTEFGTDNPFSRDEEREMSEPSRELANNLSSLSERIEEMANHVRDEYLERTLNKSGQKADSKVLELYLSLGEYSERARLTAELARKYSPHSLTTAEDLLQEKHWQVNSLFQDTRSDRELRAHWRAVAGAFQAARSSFELTTG